MPWVRSPGVRTRQEGVAAGPVLAGVAAPVEGAGELLRGGHLAARAARGRNRQPCVGCRCSASRKRVNCGGGAGLRRRSKRAEQAAVFWLPLFRPKTQKERARTEIRAPHGRTLPRGTAKPVGVY